MIPDKIYISHHYKQPIDYGFFKTENAEPYTIPYIRKDTLIEWLEGKVYEHNEDRFDDGFNAALGQVIDKLNSM